MFGNTLTSTLWRYVEQVFPEIPAVGVVSVHPRLVEQGHLQPCRYCFGSAAFEQEFGQVSAEDLFSAISSYCGRQRGGPLGTGEVILLDRNGDCHCFLFETFYNRHDALTLGVYLRPSNSWVAT